MEKKVIINGHTVSYDELLHAGIYYLVHELDAEEQKVFFDQAYNHGHAIFEDHMGYKFNLVHHGSEYQLVKPVI
jgi:hypothetical protein